MNVLNTKAGAAVRNTKGGLDGRSQQSRSLMHENSNFMSMDKKSLMTNGQGDNSNTHGAGNGGTMMSMGNIGLARQTLFSRITAGKGQTMGGDTMKETKASSNMNQGSQDGNANATQTDLGSTVFKEVLRKGVISGIGMLTA